MMVGLTKGKIEDFWQKKFMRFAPEFFRASAILHQIQLWCES